MHVIKEFWRSKRIEPRWSWKWGIIVWRNVHRLGRISVNHTLKLDLRTEAVKVNISIWKGGHTRESATCSKKRSDVMSKTSLYESI